MYLSKLEYSGVFNKHTGTFTTFGYFPHQYVFIWTITSIFLPLPYFRYYKPHLNRSRAKRAFCDVFETIFDDFRIEAAPKSFKN